MLTFRHKLWFSCLFHTPHKYAKDTNYYRAIPKDLRQVEMLNKLKIQRQSKLFMGQFPAYPIQYHWNYEGANHAVYFWEPSAKPKAVLIDFHGLNGHTGLSGHMAEKLTKQDIIVGGYDYKNFGKSEGLKRGNIDSLEQLIKSGEGFINHTRARYPQIPIYVSGLSLGGLIAFYVALRQRKDIKGAIFVNPAFDQNEFNNNLLKKIMKKIGKHIPNFQLTKPLRTNATNYDLQQYKKKDPYLYTGRVWKSTIYVLLEEMGKSTDKFQQFDLPFLCIQGGRDKLLNPFTSFELQKRARSPQKDIVVIEDMWHSVWFDDKHFQVIQLIKQWLGNNIV